MSVVDSFERLEHVRAHAQLDVQGLCDVDDVRGDGVGDRPGGFRLRERVIRANTCAVTVFANSMSPGVSSTGLVTIFAEHGDTNPSRLAALEAASIAWVGLGESNCTTTRCERQEFASKTERSSVGRNLGGR